jgi:DNA polymerase-3 subunit delta'
MAQAWIIAAGRRRQGDARLAWRDFSWRIRTRRSGGSSAESRGARRPSGARRIAPMALPIFSAAPRLNDKTKAFHRNSHQDVRKTRPSIRVRKRRLIAIVDCADDLNRASANAL